MKYYNYETFKNDTNKLLLLLREHDFEAIVTVARGGFTLAHAVSQGLNIRDVQSIRTELYDKDKKREKIKLFQKCDFRNLKRVLLLDDISDSGETLSAVMGYLKEEFKEIEFKSATLFYKKTSMYEPDFWINEVDDWIDFFWERDFLEDKTIS
ncbi:Phosphoribosyltransferase [Sulfurimonas denitrificans DSM 1251]|uniref:Phosphoribosyltransferase n=1 Tax=Sulfurimonas denitrificans (strain ATCC 33889 / DSM 1251) TaxID=326298 RepID=Q30TK5_SULDN|nr:phosphoribosyltransferase family protein [Sulfurimonas denitrificans]ABB43676.1 Phosphoribosyltransferase [Sulfurimonas denitrificans DSM 1251]MDD3442698.1 phosphoribosyltransferase family protein [Sulfurimonas denitrificans]